MLKLLIALLLSTPTFASHLDRVCETAQRFPVTWEKDLVAYFDNNEMLLSTHGGTIIGSLDRPILDIVQHELSIWLLTPNDLVEMNSAGEVLHRYSIDDANVQGRFASTMARAGNLLVITQGYAGFTGFDMEARKFVWRNVLGGADDGYASAVTFDGANLLIAAATSMPNGFTGIITADLSTGAVIKRTRYDVARWGVIGTDVKARMVGEKLLLNNGGWLHLITPAQLAADRSIRPRWVAHTIPRNGDVGPHYMMLSGDFLLHDGQVMGCGVYTDSENGTLVHRSKLFHVSLP